MNFRFSLEQHAKGDTYHSTKWKKDPVLCEVASLEVTSIQHQKGIEKTTWRTYHFFIDVESRIDTALLTSNQRHPFQVDLFFIIDVISTNFQRGILMFNW